MYGVVSSQSSASTTKSKHIRSNLGGGYDSPTNDIGHRRPKGPFFKRLCNYVKHAVTGIKFGKYLDVFKFYLFFFSNTNNSV